MPDGTSHRYDTASPNRQALTPELARANPQLFKHSLWSSLQANPQIRPFVNALEKIGQLSEEKIVLNPGWTSQTNGVSPRIELGYGEIPPTVQDRAFYTGGKHNPKTYEQRVLYRLNHEITHKIVDFLAFQGDDQRMKDLWALAATAREDGVGLTAFGSIEIHSDEIRRGNEDVTEIFNMYMWNPNYLRDYLDFMARNDSFAIGVRRQYGLADLTPEAASLLFDSVKSILTHPQGR